MKARGNIFKWTLDNFFLIPFVLLMACTDHEKTVLEIGGKFEGTIDSTGGVLKNSGSIATSYFTTCNLIKYGFCMDADSMVDYIYCQDMSFITDGVKRNETYKSVQNKHPKITPRRERGWALYLTLPSGWSASFGLPDENMNEVKIADTATIKWFFKR